MSRFTVPTVLRTASFRFAALYVGLFAVSALVLGLAVFFVSDNALRQQVDARIETERIFLVRELNASGLDRLVELIGVRGRGPGALDYLLQGPDGRHLAGEMPSTKGLKPGWTVIHVPEASEDGGRPERDRAFVTDLGGGMLLAIGSDLTQFGDVEEAITTAFVSTIGPAALLGIGGGILLSRAFLARVDTIARTAEAIIGGDLDRRVPVHGTGDDLDRLAASLNRMLDRITVLMDSLRQVSSDVAHDLRTPLTRLFQRLEGARAHATTTAEYEVAVDAAIAEAQALLDTFSALLRIAQVEGSTARTGFQEVDLEAVVVSVVDAYGPDAEEAGHRLTVRTVPCRLQGDRELLTQALANLVDNALRHTPAGTEIAIALAREGAATIRLAVVDDGPGVAAADLPRLTDRFFRGEYSRTTPGNGLGLSLVGAVAELHGAALSIENRGPGFAVTLRFPVA